MGVEVNYTVLYKDEKGEYRVEGDYEGDEGPLGGRGSDKAALLCDRYEGINFKPCNGRYPGTFKQAIDNMAFSEPGFEVATTHSGQKNCTWYTEQELHELI